MFLYDPSFKYEKGDFVIQESCIYICKPANGSPYVTGSEPKTDKVNYILYPGELASTEDYENYLGDPDNVEDKFVSSKVLYELLQKYFFGIDAYGLISEVPSGYVDLDSVLDDPNLNNGVFKVSRDFKGVPIDFYGSPSNSYFIVRQYSYKLSNDNIMRVQELIDVANHVSLIRNHILGSEAYSAWYSAYETDYTLILKYQCIKNWYINQVNSLVANNSAFNFVEIKNGFYSDNTQFNTGAIGNTGASVIYVRLDEIENYYKYQYEPYTSFDGFVVNFTISGNGWGSSVNKIKDVTINLFRDVNNSFGYQIDDDLVLSVGPKQTTSVDGSNVDYLTITLSPGYYIVSGYCRKHNIE